MPHEPRAYLWDIDQAAGAIERSVKGLDSAAYAGSELIQAAVERKFEIIGEALSQLAKLDPVLAARVPRLREIVVFRNILIHGRAGVEQQRVWRIAHQALPALRAVVVDLLRELDGPIRQI